MRQDQFYEIRLLDTDKVEGSRKFRLRPIPDAAPDVNVSIAEWVRQALELARRREPSSAMGKKLDAVRAAARHNFPSGDIESMLAEIESGYSRGSEA